MAAVVLDVVAARVAGEGFGVRPGRELGDAGPTHCPGVVGRLEQRSDDVVQGHARLGRWGSLDAAKAGEQLRDVEAEEGDVG